MSLLECDSDSIDERFPPLGFSSPIFVRAGSIRQ